MRLLTYFYLLLFSFFNHQELSLNEGEKIGLCSINKKSSGIIKKELQLKKEPKIVESKIDSQISYTKHYYYKKEALSFSVVYSAGDIIVSFGEESFVFEKGTYFRLYEGDFSDGLNWMFFTNYIVGLNGKKYLILQTFNNYNASAAHNNIYFIVEISDISKRESYSFGSFGYCDNLFGDYNSDGILDVVMVDFLSSSTAKFEEENPKGLFTAKVFSFKENDISPFRNNDGFLECQYSYDGKEILIKEGNWF